MKTKRRTEITMETHEVTIIRLRENQSPTRFCRACRASVRHLPIARAALFLGISETAAFRLVENNQVHSAESDAGALLICQNSLSDLADEKN